MLTYWLLSGSDLWSYVSVWVCGEWATGHWRPQRLVHHCHTHWLICHFGHFISSLTLNTNHGFYHLLVSPVMPIILTSAQLLFPSGKHLPKLQTSGDKQSLRNCCQHLKTENFSDGRHFYNSKFSPAQKLPLQSPNIALQHSMWIAPPSRMRICNLGLLPWEWYFLLNFSTCSKAVISPQRQTIGAS